MSIHPTFNVELNHKERRDGTHNILIRVTKERKNRRIATELNIRKKDFNKKAKFGNWVRATEPRNDYYNKTLSSRINQYQEKHTAFLGKGKHLTLDEFVAQITSHHSPSFISFYKQEISRYEKIGKYRTAEKHQFILNKLEKYLKEKHNRTDINFDEMNTSFLTDYETYLKHDLGNHQNTYYTDLKNIRTIYRNAIRQEVLEQATYPFFKFPLRQIKSSKEKLTLAEIESIRRIPLAEGKAMWHARNCFLFSYYCAGMRWGDVCTLKWSNVTDDNRLHYTMSKNKKQVDIEIPELAVEILKLYKKPDVTDSDYVFPLLKGWKDYSNPKTLLKAISSKNTVIDKELKGIAVLAKIRKNLTFHISRHTFAHHHYLKHRDVQAVQNALHHSSLKETQIYLTELGSTEELDTQLRDMFSNKMVLKTTETVPKQN